MAATSGPDSQMRRLAADLRRSTRGRAPHVPLVVLSPGFLALARHRLDRAGWLRFGPRWSWIRALLVVPRALTRPWTGGLEISPLADIGPGATILHPSLGLVVGRSVSTGDNTIFAGGNCLGSRKGDERGAIVIGRGVELGIGSVVLGPVQIGDRARVAAQAVVLADVPPGAVAAGVPARSRQPAVEER